MTRVFVYGSLFRGMHNHRILASARFVAAARTAPRFTLRDLGSFPAVVTGGSTSVLGEIYEVDGPTLERLDRLEGHPHLYRREPIELEGGLANIYVYVAELVASARAIPSGDWRGHHKEKSQ